MGFLGFCRGDEIWAHIVRFEDFEIGGVGEIVWWEAKQTLVSNSVRKSGFRLVLDFEDQDHWFVQFLWTL